LWNDECGRQGRASLSNAATELVAGDNAVVYTMLVRESNEA